MDNYDEEADFSYEDVIDCLKQFIYQSRIKNIFSELDMIPQDILKSADINLIDAEENENLVDYCKRYINFLLILRITEDYKDEVEQKDEKEKITGQEDNTSDDSDFLNKFNSAVEDGNINQMIGLIIKYSVIPVRMSPVASGELKLTPAQLTRYQAYIKSYLDDMNVQLDKYGNILNKKYQSKQKPEKNKENKETFSENNVSQKEINSEKKEEFSKGKEYYKNFILTSKKHNEEYIKKHPEDEKAIILFKRENVSVEEYFEAIRFYNKINSHIIAWINGVRLKAREFNSKEEMLEAYNSKLKK